MFQSHHSLSYNTVCVCVYVCTCTAHMSTQKGPEEKGRVLQAFAGPPGSVAGWHCQASGSLFAPTFSFRAAREMLSSGTQKGRNVTGAQLIPEDLSKTNKQMRQRHGRARKREKEEAKQRENG